VGVSSCVSFEIRSFYLKLPYLISFCPDECRPFSVELFDFPIIEPIEEYREQQVKNPKTFNYQCYQFEK